MVSATFPAVYGKGIITNKACNAFHNREKKKARDVFLLKLTFEFETKSANISAT